MKPLRAAAPRRSVFMIITCGVAFLAACGSQSAPLMPDAAAPPSFGSGPLIGGGGGYNDPMPGDPTGGELPQSDEPAIAPDEG